MLIIGESDNVVQLQQPVVTVGSFDGVHRGHRELLGYVVERAHSKGGRSVVVTFSPHPRQVLSSGVKLLNSIEEKAMLLEEIGVDVLVVLKFDEKFSRLSSESFISDYLVRRIGMKSMIVGYNHHFGHDKQGSVEVLNDMGTRMGFEVERMSQLTLDGRKVSSTEIRKIIASGNMSLAAQYLAHPYIIIGRVESGRVISPERDKLMPADGEYDVKICGMADRLNVTGGKAFLRGVEHAEKVLIEFV